MLGAIAGDMVGSVYEASPIKTTRFPLFSSGCRFTDDSVLTLAVADAILQGRDYRESLREFGRRHPDAGYGGNFYHWLMGSDPSPYHSWGNGSAMRVSPVGFAFDTEQVVLEQAKLSAECTHDHPEGIKGAQAVALAVFLAHQGASKDGIRAELERRFGYDLRRRLEHIRPGYTFDVSCQGSVPESILCFLEGDDWESSVRNAISMGGDSDTMACIAGGIAEAFWGALPPPVRRRVHELLSDDLWRVAVQFTARFMDKPAQIPGLHHDG
jgi:ADP-ribosylglycohydrolase